MNELRYSPEALKDLDEIWEYIEMELCNPEAVQGTVDAILDATERLRQFPQSGARINAASAIASDYRFVQAGHFLAFYRHQDSIVYIDRILYERRDCLRILLEPK